MNYITEINRFYDWLETNPVSDSSIVLWHALMNINNKCGWKPQFAVAISSIQNKTGLSKSSILRARNLLQQAGRIIFVTRNGQLSTVYTLISFQGDAQSYAQKKIAVHTDTQSGTQSGTQSEAQSGAQTVTIPKLKKTKLNKEVVPAAPSPPVEKESEPFWDLLVKTWFDFNIEKFGDKPSFVRDEPKILKRIVHLLKKRADDKKAEWTEARSVTWFKSYLDKAFEDPWLKINFLLSNLEKQFDKIILNQNGSNQGNTGKTIPTGRTIVRDQL